MKNPQLIIHQNSLQWPGNQERIPQKQNFESMSPHLPYGTFHRRLQPNPWSPVQ